MKNSVKFDAVRVKSAPEVLVDQIMKQIKSGMDKCISSAVKVVDCIEVGDVERAGEAMVEHLNTVNESHLKEFPAER